MKLQTSQKLLFIGDSITDCGRARFDEKGADLGNGYVRDIAALLGATYPNYTLEIVNKGIGGNTTRDLKARWDNDVSRLHPDWLTIIIGTNDVWRQFDAPDQDHVLPDEFEANLRQLISGVPPQLSSGLVLMTPFFIEPSRADPMRARMDEYSDIVRKVARESDAIFVDTQAAFNRVLEVQPSSALADDRVHPNAIGHMVIARAWLNAIGFSWS